MKNQKKKEKSFNKKLNEKISSTNLFKYQSQFIKLKKD